MNGERRGPATGGDLDPPEARVLRAELVRRVTAYPPWPAGETWDPRVIQAIAEVPRHLFVPRATLEDAYADDPYPIGHGQTISQPTVVAIMTQALELSGRERVLEIGTGSGYQAAVLARLAGAVFSIERIGWLGPEAAARLAALGYDNVKVRVGDGYEGWPDEAPFDRVVVTAAPAGVPEALLDQLADGGICVAPVGEGWTQTLLRWRKDGEGLTQENLGSVRFVPMLPGTD
jgi:protein-L-isoaspartate(D-aspartate) O-methyltransferase